MARGVNCSKRVIGGFHSELFPVKVLVPVKCIGGGVCERDRDALQV